MSRGHARDDRGAGSILMLICLMFVGVAAYVAICGASWVRSAHSADTIADMAALAGAQAFADGGDACSAARETAADNGASLTSCAPDQAGGQLVVRVQVDVAAHPSVPGGPNAFTGTATAGRT